MKAKGVWGTLDPFIERTTIMGRSVANADFLQTLLQEDPFDAYHFFLADGGQATALRGFLQERHPRLLQEGRVLLAGRPDLPQALQGTPYACFHLSDCINYPAYLARLRNLVAPDIFPITSVTHSLSYARYAKDYLAQLWPGCTARDAIGATSETARGMLLAAFEQLRRDYGLDASCRAPAVHVLPLGIDVAAYTPPTAQRRQELRRAQGLGEDVVVLLVFARLSHTAKLDVLALLRALVRAVAPPLSMHSFALILAGAQDPREEQDYLLHVRNLAGVLGLPLQVVCNPDETAKHELFALSDVFVSPVDNYQETFGLTLLEAGAMELPAVVSDFDGYRDIVRHGETGLLVPTYGARSSTTLDATAHLLLDNQHHLLGAQQLAVDIPALALALRKLALSPGLRGALGRAARQRVLQEFSLQRALWRWLALWEQLQQQPVSPEERQRLRELRHPLQLPLSGVFGGYPAELLPETQRLVWSRSGEAHYRGREGLVVYGGLQSFLEPERVRSLLFLARKGLAAGELEQRFAEQEGLPLDLARWCVLWALKHDLLEREQAG